MGFLCWHRLRVLSAVAGLIVLGASCGGDSDPSTGTPNGSAPTITPSATPTQTAATVEEAVLRDYLNYWDVYADALLNLDTGRLNEVMTGPRLERALNEVQNLRSQNRAVSIDVENQPVVVNVAGDEATILDRYENRSHFVNPSSKEPLTQPSSSEELRDMVSLIRVGAVWKVVDIVREGQ